MRTGDASPDLSDKMLPRTINVAASGYHGVVASATLHQEFYSNVVSKVSLDLLQ